MLCGVVAWVAANMILAWVTSWCCRMCPPDVVLSASTVSTRPSSKRSAPPPAPPTKRQARKAAAKLAVETERALHTTLVSRLEAATKPVTLWSTWQAASMWQRILIALTLAVVCVDTAAGATGVQAIPSNQVLPAVNHVCD